MILRRNYPEIPIDPTHPRQTADPSTQEYELLLEFDLKREKEKNAILEERLKNKETFIQQMKHFQEELTSAYEQCKNQLILSQQKIHYLQNVQFREYHEEIAELKHALVLQTQFSKRNSLSKEDKLTIRTLKNHNDKGIHHKNSDRRDSKVHSHYATRRDSSPNDQLEGLIEKDLKKSANFINHFLQMTECYLQELKSQTKLTKKLKRSWKWIKDVVNEWDHLKLKEKSYEDFRTTLADLYDLEEDVELKVLLETIKSRQS